MDHVGIRTDTGPALEHRSTAPLTSATTRVSATVRGAWIGVAAAVASLLLYGAGGRDDSHITYVAAQRLIDTGRIVNVNGDRVEQASSLLHTVALAAVGWLTGRDAMRASLVLGLLATVCAVVAATALAERMTPGSGSVAALFVGTSLPFAYWSTGGLETPLACLTIMVLCLACTRVSERASPARVLVAALASFAFVAVRPETGLVLIGATGFMAVRARVTGQRDSAVRWAGATALGVGSVAALIGWRLAHFGTPTPRPVVMKMPKLWPLDALQTHRWLERFVIGSRYLLAVGGFVTVLMLGIGAVRAGRDAFVQSSPDVRAFGGILAVLGILATVSAGGDWMEGGRLIAPYLSLLLVLLASALSVDRRRHLAVTAVVTAQVATLCWFAVHGSTGMPLLRAPYVRSADGSTIRPTTLPFPENLNRVHARDAVFASAIEPIIGDLVGHGGPTRVRIGSGQAGLVVGRLATRFPGRVEYVNMLGISTAQLDPCRTRLDRPTFHGTLVTLRRWRNRDRCSVPLPDAYFDLGSPRGRDTQLRGFAVVWEQHATVPGLGPMRAVNANQFLAVRDDLISTIRCEHVPDLPRCRD